MPNVTSLRPDDPRRVGRYRLTGRVDEFAHGDAGPSAVFLAQRVDGETVLVTLPAEAPSADAAARDRFAAEARAARRVPPFCVARILDAGFEEERPYLVTEWVPGATLAQAVALEGPLPAGALRALAIGCATGLASIHQAGLVHGQFGPEMVVLSREGPRVIDFTITPPYGAATPGADMLAWARTILFAAVGRPPAPKDLTALPGELRSAVTGCLTPDPTARPPARDVLTELLSGHDLSTGLLAEGSRAGHAAARTAVSAAAPPGRPARRRTHPKALLWIAAFAACVLAIATAAIYITGRHPGPGAPLRAKTRAGAGAERGGETSAARSSGESRASPPPLTIPAQFAGNWSGTVHQASPAINVTVRLALPAGASHGTIAYPQLSCTGTLAPLSSRPSLLTLRLTISGGQKTCVSGQVRLATEPNGTLMFTFLQRGGSNPTGTLAKRS
jgi:eukaryotic-like serine/threonine-protein kinase